MQRLGEYELEGQIGAGSSGTVWMAHRLVPPEQIVALKRMRSGGNGVNLGRIRRETGMLAELAHPNIMPVLEVLEDGEGIAVAMEYAPGGSLERILAERGRLSPGEVVGVAAPMAEALATAHRRGILHGDVKPANVLFGPDGEPLLSDFGAGRLVHQQTSPHVISAAEYMAPELLDGAGADPRSDVYSLGVVCYEAFTGAAPYRGGLPAELDRNADVPPPVVDVIERAIARDPRQRFASADELAWSLRRALPHQEIRLPGVVHKPGRVTTRGRHAPAHTAGPDPSVEGPLKRRLVPVVVAVAVVGAGVGVLVLGPLSGGGSGDCPQVQRPPVEPGGQLLAGDPEGDGCAVYGTYQLHELASGQRSMLLSITVNDQEKRISLGDPGDQLFLGDWNCDGTDTPGLYRREVGEIQYFGRWPETQDPLQPDEVDRAPVGGMSHLNLVDDGAKDEGDCDHITVAAP